MTAMKPNILIIMADQFGAHALNRERDTDAHFNTPHLDRLMAGSVNFTQAYTSFPLCVPARSSMVTGRYPHQLGVMSNSAAAAPPTEPGRSPNSLGHWFAAHGYDCAYAGKWHALRASADAADGFTPIHPFGDEGLVQACTDWLDARSAERPHLLVASFDDPHTICEYARSQAMPYGNVAAGETESAPPLPANYPSSPYAPTALAVERARASTMYGTDGYTPDDWRQYRAAYAALVERVDRRIGQLLDSVDFANTVVVFLSDHGDGDASHGWNQKTALYQECIRIPFLLRAPALVPSVVADPTPAILGLLPTLCDVAGIPVPEGLPAASVLSGKVLPVVIQTVFSGGTAPISSGRALVSGRYKYTVYSWGKHREQLHDVVADPGEQRNLAVELACHGLLERMRAALHDWAVDHGDTGFLKKLVLPRGTTGQQREHIFTPPY